MRAKPADRLLRSDLTIADTHNDLVDVAARVMGCGSVELECFDTGYGEIFLSAQPSKDLVREFVRVPEAEMGRAEVCV